MALSKEKRSMTRHARYLTNRSVTLELIAWIAWIEPMLFNLC